MLTPKAVGRRIRAARCAAGLLQDQLADQVGVTQALVSYWETGRRRPGFGHLRPLAAALGVAVEWLLLVDGQRQGSPRG